MNMEYIKAGWMNNMSARGTFAYIYHLRRLLSYADRVGDRKLMVVVARLIYIWAVNEPNITCAAVKCYVERG